MTMTIRALLVSSAIVATLGCASTTYVENPLETAPATQKSGGVLTAAGIILNDSSAARADYDTFMGKQCLDTLKAMGNVLHRANYSQCNPLYQYDPRYAQFCHNNAQQIAQLKAREAACLQKKEAYKQLSLTIRAVPHGQALAPARAMKVVGSGALSIEDKSFSIPMMPHADLANTACFVVTNALGKKVPVRGAEHADRYTFSAKHITHTSKILAARNHLAEIEKNILSLHRELASAEGQLQRSGAFKNGQCTKPAQAQIPPKPKGMNSQDLHVQTTAACTDLMMRRFSQQDTMDAFYSLNLDDEIALWMEWSKDRSKQARCTRNVMPQADSWLRDKLCLFDTKKFCIQDAFTQCKAAARQRCSGPIQAWERTVRRIQSEPERALNSCRSFNNKAASLRAQLRDLERKRAQHAGLLSRLEQTQKSLTAPVKLEDIPCNRVG